MNRFLSSIYVGNLVSGLRNLEFTYEVYCEGAHRCGAKRSLEVEYVIISSAKAKCLRQTAGYFNTAEKGKGGLGDYCRY